MKDIEKVRQSIIDVAASLFEKYSYTKTSMDEIARCAHKAKASLYYHFDSKESIMKAVLSKEFQIIKIGLDDIKKQYAADLKTQLNNYLVARMRLLREAKIYRRYILSSYICSNHDAMFEVVKTYRESFDLWEQNYFENICIQGVESGVIPDEIKPDAFAKMLKIVLKGLEIQFFQSEDYESLRSTYEAIINFMILRDVKVSK